MSETIGTRSPNALLEHLTGVPDVDETCGLGTAAKISSSAVLQRALCLKAAKFMASAARSAQGQHITTILSARRSPLSPSAC